MYEKGFETKLFEKCLRLDAHTLLDCRMDLNYALCRNHSNIYSHTSLEPFGLRICGLLSLDTEARIHAVTSLWCMYELICPQWRWSCLHRSQFVEAIEHRPADGCSRGHDMSTGADLSVFKRHNACLAPKSINWSGFKQFKEKWVKCALLKW